MPEQPNGTISTVDPDFAPADFFALRTPLLPFDEFLAFGDGLTATKATPECLEEALTKDRTLVRARLRAIVRRPEVREALFLASPSLYESLDQWLDRPDSNRGRRVERVLVRYFERMSTRATPFGLFAGCSIGIVGSATRFEIAPRAHYRRHTRLDMDYLSALSDVLPHDAALCGDLRFWPNSSLYRAAGRLRYAQARLDGNVRSYHLVAVELTDYLEATLERAAVGACPSELAAALVADDISVTEAEDYIGELIDSQILVSELAPPITGAEPMQSLLTTLRRQPAASQIIERLDEVHSAVQALDDSGIGIDTDRYHAIARLLAALPATVELSRLFQVDMFKPATEARLGREVLDEIQRGVTLLHRTSYQRDEALQKFAEEFTRRYEGREVPLTEALDEESGIGFASTSTRIADASPLLAGLVFPPSEEIDSVRWGTRQKFLLRKLEQSWKARTTELALTDADWKTLEANSPAPLPDSFAVMATIIAPSDAALAAGKFRVHVEGVVGPSAARLLGRFCHGDQTLTDALTRHLRAEEALEPDSVFAEIVHLPEGRVGNVLLRPILREYELPFLGRSGVPLERQLTLSDLRVSITHDGLILLRSAQLGRRIIPRLSAAHGFDGPQSLALYRFLGSLQSQSQSGVLSWNWGPLDGARFLPRITSGRLIFSLARWQVESESLKPLGSTRGAEQFRRAQALRQELGLPRFVVVEDDDNTLPVDLENVLSIETFAQLVRDRKSVKLVELLSTADALCVHGPEGRFAHELVIPMLRRREPTTLAPRPLRPGAVTRRFPPGSEWLYAKFYGGRASVDQILTGPVAQVVRDLAGAFDRWFFLRYADPDWHLRLRFHGAPERLHGELLPALETAAYSLLGDGRGWRLQLDTYEREVERYGGDEGVALSERLFHVDAEAVLAIVELLSGDEGADARWRLTLCGIDALLDNFKFDLAARRRLMKKLRNSLGDEPRFVGGIERQLGSHFRRHRHELEALLDHTREAHSNLAPAIELFDRRSERLVPIVAELEDAARRGRLTCTIEELTVSYLHMHANRLLRSAHRDQELVIYDFLNRLYDSQAARLTR